MRIRSARFTGSHKRVPESGLPEFAFAGRSNVGKSSLINMLCGQKNLAKTSSTPGKTRLINRFLVNDSFLFTDLPGYGYAKAGKQERMEFEDLVSHYIRSAKLRCLFLLIDIRLPLQQVDAEFMNWLGKKKIPFAIIFTKCDKLSNQALEKNFQSIEEAILRSWEAMPGYFFSSSRTRTGHEEILGYIGELLQ